MGINDTPEIEFLTEVQEKNIHNIEGGFWNEAPPEQKKKGMMGIYATGTMKEKGGERISYAYSIRNGYVYEQKNYTSGPLTTSSTYSTKEELVGINPHIRNLGRDRFNKPKTALVFESLPAVTLPKLKKGQIHE